MRKWIPLLIVAAAFLASAVVYPKLPEIIPTHWDMSGRPNDWGNRVWAAWVLPVFLLGMWGLVQILPRIDPRGANYAKFGGAFEGIIDSVMLFMLALHVVVLRASLGYPVQIQRVVPIGIGALLIVIGNLLPRARPNWFVGIRTPWTLSSDRVWERTHRFGGRVFVAAGLLILVAALFWARWANAVLFGAMIIVTASVLIYSYLEWRREFSASGAAK